MTALSGDATELRSRPDDCRFCGIERRERLLDYGDGYAVVPSYGALVAGWVLIVPTVHVLTMAELPVEARRPLTDLVARVESRLSAAVGPTVLFEHGPAAVGRSPGCGVDHAHLHVVPVAVDLRAVAHETDVLPRSLQWVASAWPWDGRSAPERDYLFVRDVDGAGWLAEADELPSQAFRQTLCRHLGQQHWDWKDERTTDASDSTWAFWSNAALSGCEATA